MTWLTDEVARAFDVTLGGTPVFWYGPNDPFTVARKNIDAYLQADLDGKEAALLRMFGLPEGCERAGCTSDPLDAVIFLAFMQPILGALPWNSEKPQFNWTAFPTYGDARFSVGES